MHAKIPQWQMADDGVGPEPNCVDLWLYDLGGAQAAGDVTQRTLAHASLRATLSRYTGIPAAALPIGRQPKGKPFLDLDTAGPHFNLSHTTDWALLALSPDRAVGVDIECDRAVPRLMQIAHRAFPEEVVDALLTTAEPLRTAGFLSRWTRLEAGQKALGHGIFDPRPVPGQLLDWQFAPFVGAFAAVAVVADGRPVRFRCFRGRMP